MSEYAPDGSTIPTASREPAIDSGHRLRLLQQLGDLHEHNPVAFQRIADQWQELGCPNLRTHRVTKAHGFLLDMLLSIERMTR